MRGGMLLWLGVGVQTAGSFGRTSGAQGSRQGYFNIGIGCE